MTNINTYLITEIEELQMKRGLTALEQELLEEQYKMIEEATYIEVDVYGDTHQY